jgi:hypothetical protein
LGKAATDPKMFVRAATTNHLSLSVFLTAVFVVTTITTNALIFHLDGHN